MEVILSIKPKYANEILNGTKKVEYRKQFPAHIKKVYIYASHPVKRIVAEFKVSGLISDNPKNLWDLTERRGGISKDEYFKYFRGKVKAIAVEIGKLNIYEKPINPKEKYSNWNAPQSYRYVESYTEMIKPMNKESLGYLKIK